jgi:serine/threonine protein kinase
MHTLAFQSAPSCVVPLLGVYRSRPLASVRHALDSPDEYALVLDYCHHQDLLEYCFAIFGNGPIPASAARSLLRRALVCLAAIHAAGLLHNDIKASPCLRSCRQPRNPSDPFHSRKAGRELWGDA